VRQTTRHLNLKYYLGTYPEEVRQTTRLLNLRYYLGTYPEEVRQTTRHLNLRYYLGTYPEEVRQTTRHLNQSSRALDWETNGASCAYQAGVLHDGRKKQAKNKEVEKN
jgi:hypothetical protein